MVQMKRLRDRYKSKRTWCVEKVIICPWSKQAISGDGRITELRCRYDSGQHFRELAHLMCLQTTQMVCIAQLQVWRLRVWRNVDRSPWCQEKGWNSTGDEEEKNARQRWTNWRAPEEKQRKQPEVQKMCPGEKIWKLWGLQRKKFLGRQF